MQGTEAKWRLPEEVDWYQVRIDFRERKHKGEKSRQDTMGQDLTSALLKRPKVAEKKSVVLHSLAVADTQSVLLSVESDEDAKALLCSQVAGKLDELSKVEGSLTREDIEGCEVIFHAIPKPFINLVLIPLLSTGSTSSCGFAERILMSARSFTHHDEFLQLAASSGRSLCNNDAKLCFWQRTAFTKPIPETLLSMLLKDMETIPPNSVRLAAAILALTKSNSSSLAPYVPQLLNLLTRAAGGLVASTRKIVQGLAKC